MKIVYRLIVVGCVSLFAITSCVKDNEFENKETLITRNVVELINADSIKSYVQMLQDMGTRYALADNRRKVATAILHKFQSFGFTSVVLDSFYLDTYSTWQYNVVADICGRQYPDSVVIVGGHHDSILREGNGDPFVEAPGADDNASGVAVTLEVARILKSCQYEPTHTIRFVTFAAEELGLLGSSFLSYFYSTNELKVKFMLNNDMVGYYNSDDSTSWVINIIDYQNSIALRYKAEDVFSNYTCLETVNDNKYQTRSDSYPFYVNGYKALFFITNGDDPNYHSLNDRVEACNFRFAREVAKGNCALVLLNCFNVDN